jgi:3-hydroxyisobutyrate dehydrogenase-like beta-hydroxyacid dehydrogenase
VKIARKQEHADCRLLDRSSQHNRLTANAIEEHGGKLITCPVFGAPVIAERGQLACVLARPKEEVEEVDSRIVKM